MVNSMRPGYKPPTAYDLSHEILDDCYEKAIKDCKLKLNGETCTKWLNILKWLV